MRDSKSLKKGIDSPMRKLLISSVTECETTYAIERTHAMTQPTETMETQTAQPLTVCDLLWGDFSLKIWKKMARDVTSE